MRETVCLGLVAGTEVVAYMTVEMERLGDGLVTPRYVHSMWQAKDGVELPIECRGIAASLSGHKYWHPLPPGYIFYSPLSTPLPAAAMFELVEKIPEPAPKPKEPIATFKMKRGDWEHKPAATLMMRLFDAGFDVYDVHLVADVVELHMQKVPEGQVYPTYIEKVLKADVKKSEQK